MTEEQTQAMRAVALSASLDTDCSAFWAAQDAHFEALHKSDYERRVDAFESAYDAHIEEMCCPF